MKINKLPRAKAVRGCAVNVSSRLISSTAKKQADERAQKIENKLIINLLIFRLNKKRFPMRLCFHSFPTFRTVEICIEIVYSFIVTKAFCAYDFRMDKHTELIFSFITNMYIGHFRRLICWQPFRKVSTWDQTKCKLLHITNIYVILMTPHHTAPYRTPHHHSPLHSTKTTHVILELLTMCDAMVQIFIYVWYMK